MRSSYYSYKNTKYLQRGDILKKPCTSIFKYGGFYHYGVYLGDGYIMEFSD